MIDTIIFDLGGVLVDFEPERGMRTIGFSEETIAVFNEKIFAKLWEECDRFPYSDEEIRSLFKSRVPEYSDEVDILWDKLQAVTGTRNYSNEWIKDLKARGYKLYVLSNYGKQSFAINSPIYDFLSDMDGIVVSYEIEKCKPEPEIYLELCKRYGVEPKNSVFIDDRQVNIDGAKKCGYNGIVFENYEQAREELESLLNKF